MNDPCTAFERWLDDGRPAPGAEAARAHAAACVHCTSLLELEEALAAPSRTAAPAGFSDQVMDRIHGAPRPAARFVRPAFATPLWVRAFMDPLVALVVTATLLTWFGRGAITGIGDALAARLSAAHWPALGLPPVAFPGAAAFGSVSQWLTSVSANPAVLAGLLLGISPAVLMASWVLFRWTDRLASGPSLASMMRSPGAHAVAR